MKQAPKALFMLSMYDIFCSSSIAMPLTLLEKRLDLDKKLCIDGNFISRSLIYFA